MLSLPPSVRVFVCTQPVDMRLAFDRLAMLAEQVLQENPYSGHLFVYVNRRVDRVKILYWDRSGLAFWYKRLEKGTFRFPLPDRWLEDLKKLAEAAERTSAFPMSSII